MTISHQLIKFSYKNINFVLGSDTIDYLNSRISPATNLLKTIYNLVEQIINMEILPTNKLINLKFWLVHILYKIYSINHYQRSIVEVFINYLLFSNIDFIEDIVDQLNPHDKILFDKILNSMSSIGDELEDMLLPNNNSSSDYDSDETDIE